MLIKISMPLHNPLIQQVMTYLCIALFILYINLWISAIEIFSLLCIQLLQCAVKNGKKKIYKASHKIKYGVVPHFCMLSFKFRRGVRGCIHKDLREKRGKVYSSSGSGTEVMIILR